MQFDEGEFRGAIDCNQHGEFALLGADLGDIDVEVADGVALELTLVGHVPLDCGQLRDAVALEAAV
jgi:hypothetical protein